MVAASATDIKINGARVTTFTQLEEWLDAIGFGGHEILAPVGVYGLAFYGRFVYDGDSPTRLYVQLWNIIESNGTPSTPGSPRHRRLTHDVLMMWAHLTYGGDVFVTSDVSDFVDRGHGPRFVALGAGQILTPSSAVRALAQP